MNSMVKKILLSQIERYPELQPRDILKVLYQSEFGCGHFVTDENHGMNMLLDELNSLNNTIKTEEFIEPIGEVFNRVHLAFMERYNMAASTLFRLFMLSSQFNPGTNQGLWEKLKHFHELCTIGLLPFNPLEVLVLIKDYKDRGFPAVHHSDVFRQLYQPAYRVVRSDYCKLVPLLCRIDELLTQKKKVILAIDGNCGAGKTTLAVFLSNVYDCNIFHMDDFFLRLHQRTEKRLSEPGGNVDYERFYSEVLEPLICGKDFNYRPYSCRTQMLSSKVNVEMKSLNIIEGSYSMHPALYESYDISVFLSIDPKLQDKRILSRNGAEMYKRFIEEWIPMENQYFDCMNIASKSDYVFEGLIFEDI